SGFGQVIGPEAMDLAIEHTRPMNVINHMLTIVLNPAVFEDYKAFVAEAEKFVAYIKQTPPAADTESVLMPGDPERRCKLQRLEGGIPIDLGTWQQLLDTAASVGISEAECTSLAT
ncbi:MAG: Ldh family oxidoreductase, partial [Gammaproteobacteria bacterium]|nr:Ldh family oxidoreductase [Gammaproteobacteria bacterium]